MHCANLETNNSGEYLLVDSIMLKSKLQWATICRASNAYTDDLKDCVLFYEFKNSQYDRSLSDEHFGFFLNVASACS